MINTRQNNTKDTHTHKYNIQTLNEGRGHADGLDMTLLGEPWSGIFKGLDSDLSRFCDNGRKAGFEGYRGLGEREKAQQKLYTGPSLPALARLGLVDLHAPCVTLTLLVLSRRVALVNLIVG